MTPAARTLLAELEAAAKSALAAEDQLRKSLSEQIKRLERQRAFAFRRTRLVRALADAVHATEADDQDLIWAEQRRAVREELEWSGESKAYDAILVRLRAVGGAVSGFVRSPEPQATSVVLSELDKFETWFEEEHGKSFYALFDQYVQQVPVVDF